MRKFGRNVDVLAVSCDSFVEETNVRIGRGTGRHLGNLVKVREWCEEEGVKFKINTVVNRFNFEEDMRREIEKINPFRWKGFQVLVVPGENDGKEEIRDTEKFVVTDEEFEVFCERHKGVKGMVKEGNEVMRGSYLILDEYMRFLDQGREEPGKSILKVGVEEGLRAVRWDERVYDWSRKGGEHRLPENLEW